MKPDACPACFIAVDDVAGINTKDESPNPGDLGICPYCGVFLVFSENSSLRLMTDDEFSRLPEQMKKLLLRSKQACKNFFASQQTH